MDNRIVLDIDCVKSLMVRIFWHHLFKMLKLKYSTLFLLLTIAVIISYFKGIKKGGISGHQAQKENEGVGLELVP